MELRYLVETQEVQVVSTVTQVAQVAAHIVHSELEALAKYPVGQVVEQVVDDGDKKPPFLH